MSRIKRLAKYIVFFTIGIVIAFTSLEIYRTIKPISAERDRWLGYVSTENYRSLRILESPGRVHEEIINFRDASNPSFYRLTFTAYNSPSRVKSLYPVDTLSGNSLIQVDGLGAMKYSESQKGKMITVYNQTEQMNDQYAYMYYDYDNSGTLDCICKKTYEGDSEVWITVGKNLVSVNRVPENSTDGIMQTSDGDVAYGFVKGCWQEL